MLKSKELEFLVAVLKDYVPAKDLTTKAVILDFIEYAAGYDEETNDTRNCSGDSIKHYTGGNYYVFD